MSEKLSKKIEELIEISIEEKELSVTSILCAIQGARISGDINILAYSVSDCVRNTLLPLMKQRRDNSATFLN